MTQPTNIQVKANPAPAAVIHVGTSKFLCAYLGNGTWSITEWDETGTVFTVRLPAPVLAFIADPKNATELLQQAFNDAQARTNGSPS